MLGRVSVEALQQHGLLKAVRGVRVNGALVPLCIAASEAEGYAECVMHRPDGHLLPVDQDGQHRTCRYAGTVRLVVHPALREQLERLFGVEA